MLSVTRSAGRAALAVLVLIATACQMPHMQQPVTEPETPVGVPTGEEPGSPELPDTPTTPGPAPAGAPPALTIADVSAGEADGALTFTVSLSFAGGTPVTVGYATENGTATAGADYDAASGTLTFPSGSTEAQTVGVTVTDDAVDEGAETFTMRLHDAQGATLADGEATARINDDDGRAVKVEPDSLNVDEGASARYTVVLGSRPTASVTVTVEAPTKLSTEPAVLKFEPGEWAIEQTVTVEAEHDNDAIVDKPVAVLHPARGGDYEGEVAALQVKIVELDTPTLAIADAGAAESDGVLRFAVSLSLESDTGVTVDFATVATGDTATAGADYQAASGTLRFPARTRAARTITVTVTNDGVDEPDEETFTVTLSNPVNAVLAGAGTTAVATGTITDDDAEPKLTIADARLSEGSGSMQFTVTLAGESAQPVTVAYGTANVTATAGSDYTAVGGTLTFAPGTTERTIAVPIIADTLDEPEEEQFRVQLSDPQNAALEEATATGTITDDDAEPKLTIADARLGESGGSMRFAVTLDGASGRLVAVAYATTDETATAGADYTVAGGTLTFTAGTTEHMIAVPIADDGLDEDNETFTVTLSEPRNAALAVATATGTITDDDAEPTLTIADASLGEGGGSMRFTVTLAGESVEPVTVAYATEDVTATAGADYSAANGTLTFAAAAPARTIAVPVTDDGLDEDSETFTVTLRDPQNAALEEATATGTITDDDTRGVQVQPTALTLYAGGSTATYTVVLTAEPAAEVVIAATVSGSTAVSVNPTELTFTAANWASGRNVTATAAAAAQVGDTATIGHTVSGGDYEGEAAASVAVAVAELFPLKLSSLQVTGGGTMYPDFAAGVHHYALTCEDDTTLQVAAQARRSGARLTLLRNNEDDNQVSTGSLDAAVVVNGDHDVAVELSDFDGTVTYVVHCLPSDFPDITILKKTDGAMDGLLFVTPSVYNSRYSTSRRYLAVIDYNGVPRFHRSKGSNNFQRYANGPVIDGKQVRYSYGAATLLDKDFAKIRGVRPVSPLANADPHDFRITENGNFLFLSYQRVSRDLSDFNDPDGNPYPSFVEMKDSVIQELTPDGEAVFDWNSWDHMKLVPDCDRLDREYAHINSLQMVDGDIVASFKGCKQVLRIDRSSDTGAIEWQLGGTSPPRSETTEYLEIVDDDDNNNEFCGQHHATLTDSDTVLLFDNGDGCLGARKNEGQYTRVVEYDISSGSQAAFVRDYALPDEQGFADFAGGVTALDNGHWLITWGRTDGETVSLEELISISEVDPATGASLFEMNMSKSPYFVQSYRAYHELEVDIEIPMNLP